MPEANGVFVKIFRNEKAWKQNEGMLEIAKGKFEAEEEYRKKLASEAGLTEDQAKLNFNHHIDPRLFYPELDCNSPEYIAWRYGNTEENCHTATTEELANGDRDIGWPTEVMEEIALFRKHGIFGYDDFVCRAGNPKFIYRFLYGISGNKRYLVAWWGEKKYYDEIQSKLADLAELNRRKEENKRQKEEGKKQEEQEELNRRMELPAVPQKKFFEAVMVVTATFVISLISLVSIAVVANAVVSPNKQKQTVFAQTLEECEKLHKQWPPDFWDDKVMGKVTEGKCVLGGNHYILLCQDANGEIGKFAVEEKVYNRTKIGDIISFETTQTSCTWCLLKDFTRKSIYELKDGSFPDWDTVVEKEIRPCKYSSEIHYRIIVSTLERERGGYGGTGFLVSKALYDKFKIGDKIPFKRPEY